MQHNMCIFNNQMQVTLQIVCFVISTWVVIYDLQFGANGEFFLKWQKKKTNAVKGDYPVLGPNCTIPYMESYSSDPKRA